MKDWSALQNAFPPTPEHYTAHMRATLDNMEGLTVKRRHRISLVILVTVLVLAFSTALAYTIISNQYFEDVATIQFVHGYYDDWTLQEKLSILQLMKDYGVEMDAAEADALLAGGMDDAERERRIDALMIAKYGIEGRTDVIGLESILERELGEFDTWPMEQKAWYSQMLLDSGLMGSDDDIFRMPGENVIQPDAALAVARKEIMAVYGVSESELDSREVRWVYRTHVSDKEEKLLHYEFRFLTEEGYGAPYYACSVSNDGRVMGGADIPGMMSPAEQKAYDEQRAASRVHEVDDEVNGMILDYVEANGLGTLPFIKFPIEHKAACLEQIKPVILAHMAADPLYAEAELMVLSTRTYGLPDDKAIPREEAIALCQQALAQELGISAELAETIQPGVEIYDITDPAAPLWKLYFGPSTSDAYYAAYPDDFRAWQLHLNACTGELVKLWKVDNTDMSLREVYESRY